MARKQELHCVKRMHAILRDTYENHPDALHTNVTDALTDLMHYCMAKGIDFDNQLRIARDHCGVESSNTEEGRDWRKEQRTKA